MDRGALEWYGWDKVIAGVSIITSHRFPALPVHQVGDLPRYAHAHAIRDPDQRHRRLPPQARRNEHVFCRILHSKLPGHLVPIVPPTLDLSTHTTT
jgi:hypothetical protein